VRIVFADEANADLESIGDYIAQDNPARALTFVAELGAASIAIGDMPLAFPLVPRHERFGIRRRPFGNYLIFYRIEQDRVTITNILHGARDYESLLFPEQ
jgi:toxin ParE1/3/4